MVAEYCVAPKAMLHPERAVQQRIVLLGGSEVEPDAPEAVKGLEIRPRHVARIIPKEASVECRQVCHHGGTEDQCPRFGIRKSSIGHPGLILQSGAKKTASREVSRGTPFG